MTNFKYRINNQFNEPKQFNCYESLVISANFLYFYENKNTLS